MTNKTKEIKTYNCTTAKITAERGNIPKADIMQMADDYSYQMRQIKRQMHTSYWLLHNSMSEQEFTSTNEQIEALEKLGQFAIALKAVNDAHVAIVSAHCFS